MSTWEEGTSIFKMALTDCLQAYLQGVLLTNDRDGESPIRNSVILGQVVMGYNRKQDNQPNKQCSSMTSASISASRFLP